MQPGDASQMGAADGAVGKAATGAVGKAATGTPGEGEGTSELLQLEALTEEEGSGVAALIEARLALLPPLVETTKEALRGIDASMRKHEAAQGTLSGRVGELLHRRKVKMVDLLRVYTKDGKVVSGAGAVSKSDFRQSVRKLASAQATDAEIDA
eukprot:6380572-Prymnesium_polylepis.1